MFEWMRKAARIDPAELAWAAGFFDGEGSTFARTEASRPGYRRLNVAVPQSGGASVPDALKRFQAAMLGMGTIGKPRLGIYQWRAIDFTQAHATIGLLWPELGEVKRIQAAAAIRIVDDQYRSGRYRASPGRRRPALPGTPADRSRSVRRDLDLAWAAGFLDAEGCFGLARGRPRVDGAPWYRIRVSADQHGDVDLPAAVLIRLHRVLGLGRIERHGEPDDFKWVAEGLPPVQQVLAAVHPWLGKVKSEQARHAIAAFTAQVRHKGDRMQCKRGHLYDRRLVTPKGRSRAYCNTCARLRGRHQRAALGIKPRQFRNVRRRYTE